jgi:hypothetical protein
MPKREKPLHLDMPFDEALRRYAQADPNQTAEKEARAKKRRRQKRSAASKTHALPTVPVNS